jgi:hypothetical protein
MEVESPGLYINMHLYFLGSSLLLSEARELVKRVHHPYLWFGSTGGIDRPSCPGLSVRDAMHYVTFSNDFVREMMS